MSIMGLCIPNIENKSIFCFLALCELKMEYTLYKGWQRGRLYQIFPGRVRYYWNLLESTMGVNKAIYFVLSHIFRSFAEDMQLQK